MKISNAMYKDWIVLGCASCGEHFYSFEKINKVSMCSCGYKDIEILELEEWKAVDHIWVCKEELKKNALEKYIPLIDSLYDRFRKSVSSDELFDKLMKIVSDEIYDLM